VVGVLVLVLFAVVVAFSLGSRENADTASTSTPTPSQRPPQPVPVAAVQAFDPDDDGGGENPELAPLAVDGNATTAWETMRYFDGPVLAPYRSGVGILLDLGQEFDVADVGVRLVGGPYDVQLLAAPAGSSPPVSVAGLQTVNTQRGVSDDIAFQTEQPVNSRYVVVWLTALPPVEGGFRGGVAEVVVRS
jgi:hypothetical protein